MMIIHLGKQLKQTLDLVILLNFIQPQIKTINFISFKDTQPAELQSAMMTTLKNKELKLIIKITIISLNQFYWKMIN